jgi:hypothetical protein
MSLSTEPLKWYRNALTRGNAEMLRNFAGLTVEKAAKKARIAPEELASWESGVEVPAGLSGTRYARMLAKAAAKPCSLCGEKQDANMFWITRHDGKARMHSQCIPCRSAKQSEIWKTIVTDERKAAERTRVREYQKDDAVKERRKARSSAQYQALAAMRKRHPTEYRTLAESMTEYKALATLREKYRPQYEQAYRRYLDAVGLAA